MGAVGAKDRGDSGQAGGRAWWADRLAGCADGAEGGEGIVAADAADVVVADSVETAVCVRQAGVTRVDGGLAEVVFGIADIGGAEGGGAVGCGAAAVDADVVAAVVADAVAVLKAGLAGWLEGLAGEKTCAVQAACERARAGQGLGWVATLAVVGV